MPVARFPMEGSTSIGGIMTRRLTSFPSPILTDWMAAMAVLLLTSAAAGGLDVDGAVSSARRSLLGFTEKKGNTTFRCSPSGPCLRCQYPEKSDEKYRCSETGYRIPLNCEEIQNGSSDKTKNPQRKLLSLQDEDSLHFHTKRVGLRKSLSTLVYFNWRRLLVDDSSAASEAGGQNYVTYRSCLPAKTEEKLSVFGFELIMVCFLLVSAPITYFRQRRSATLPGIGLIRVPGSSPRL